MLVDIIIAIILGAISGFIAGKIMKNDGGLLRNIILGIIGGFVGNLVLGLFNITLYGYLGTIIVSVLGACLVIFIVNKIMK